MRQSPAVAGFLNNHREVIAAFDFFTVPSLTFRTLYCFFVIAHDRRRVLHFNVTTQPTSDWIVQHLREALPLPCPYRYILFDRDGKFGSDVFEFLKASGVRPIQSALNLQVRSQSSRVQIALNGYLQRLGSALIWPPSNSIAFKLFIEPSCCERALGPGTK